MRKLLAFTIALCIFLCGCHTESELSTDATTTTHTATTTITTTTTRPPSSVRLNVKTILQNPELPTGCEITSATILLNYYGYAVNKEQMCEYLPQSNKFYTNADGLLIGPDTNEYFIGNPHTTSGRALQCFAPVIEKAVNDYLSYVKSERRAKAIIGEDLEDLYSYLSSGHPVCVWATIDMVKATKVQGWYNDSMELVTSYRNIHCLVMTGYDEKYVYVVDPLGKLTKVDKGLFNDRYKSVGSQAVVLLGCDD